MSKYFKSIRCVVVVCSIGSNMLNKLSNIHNQWKTGHKKHAVFNTGTLVVRSGIGAIMLYNPWILINPILVILPIALDYVPLVGAVPIVKMLIVYGLDFIIL